MQTNHFAKKIAAELNEVMDQFSDRAAEKLVDRILESKRIFLAGAGRSGLMGRAFAMRLMHMGFSAYVVGETVTPAIQKDELLIIGSSSGETKSMVTIAEKARQAEASLAVITQSPESTLAKRAHLAVLIPNNTTIQPMGSLFEQSLLLFYDSVILRLVEKTGKTSEEMHSRHANLE